ncbi:MAG: hypothetical protein JJU28_17070 [Cyclobacteriaceae bacterium]|nr:hypothetical protein [Cyclobacteriaceae bacterium]
MKKVWILALILITVTVLLTALLPYTTGAARTKTLAIPQGNIPVPAQRNYPSSNHSSVQQELLDHWSSMELPDWKEKHKVTVPRIILASLLNETRIDEMNHYLQNQKAVGISGSRWWLNPEGDYDFTQSALIPILFEFSNRPEILYPETLQHLITELIVEEGNAFNLKVPKTLGLIEDTENHILMTEGTRFLKNQWYWENGRKDFNYDNVKNGMEEKLSHYLIEMYNYGIYEFNSDPYLGYTLCALLNLHTYAKGPVKIWSEKLLDKMNWQYALGSHQLRRFPPIRRQYEKHKIKALNQDYHTAAMKTWLSFYTDTLALNIERGEHIALWAAIMPYRPADQVLELSVRKPDAYFVKIGHGANSCPEIYSGNSSFLISAGGANQGKRSLILPRPIVLFTCAGERELKDVFHIMGPGGDFMKWNNTGVYEKFAVAAGPVHVPKHQKSLANIGKWQLFEICAEYYLAIYGSEGIGIMTLLDKDGKSPNQALEDIAMINPEKNIEQGNFIQDAGIHLAFDALSPKNQWVITEIDGQKTNRNFELWPDFEGYLPPDF